MPCCSKVVERGGTLLSAALITRWEGRPLVAFSFTDPAFAGQGLARACLLAAMSELTDQGERELRLVVTLANTRAVRLYTRLGFQFEPAEGWHAGRSPTPMDLSMALAYAGLDARNMRDLPTTDELEPPRFARNVQELLDFTVDPNDAPN